MATSDARRICERCHDPLSDDAPADVRTCKDYADWYARTEGDLLTKERADALMLLRLFCGLDEAMREGWAELRPDV